MHASQQFPVGEAKVGRYRVELFAGMLGFWPYAKQVSIGVPAGKPVMSRPPEMTSIIANSPATRVDGL